MILVVFPGIDVGGNIMLEPAGISSKDDWADFINLARTICETSDKHVCIHPSEYAIHYMKCCNIAHGIIVPSPDIKDEWLQYHNDIDEKTYDDMVSLMIRSLGNGVVLRNPTDYDFNEIVHNLENAQD